MTKSSILAAMLALLVSAGPCLSEGTQREGKLISEDAVRTTSAELYSDILIRACRNGWRYPRSQIESGFKRHLGELKLQLVAQGYTIVPDVTTTNSHRRLIETAFAAKRQPVASRQFGCTRQYWLDE
jgi:DNA-binding transcriptional LysR family regulator